MADRVTRGSARSLLSYDEKSQERSSIFELLRIYKRRK